MPRSRGATVLYLMEHHAWTRRHCLCPLLVTAEKEAVAGVMTVKYNSDGNVITLVHSYKRKNGSRDRSNDRNNHQKARIIAETKAMVTKHRLQQRLKPIIVATIIMTPETHLDHLQARKCSH